MARGVKTGGGSRKGVPNKIPADVKALIVGALNAKGGQAWLEQQMEINPVAFMALLGKVLPHQIAGSDGGPLVVRWQYEEALAELE